MSFITKEEILKIARMAHITLTEQEIVKMQSHVEAVLSYAARVQDIAKDVDVVMQKNSNVERDDVAHKTDCKTILAQAPEREGNYFVVPAIIENN
jgi:aspartyl-tRNA(Asn)/glutamyl-tRNA(Gln) amidotransferase subunit C